MKDRISTSVFEFDVDETSKLHHCHRHKKSWELVLCSSVYKMLVETAVHTVSAASSTGEFGIWRVLVNQALGGLYINMCYNVT